MSSMYGSLYWPCSQHPIWHIAMPEAGAIHLINGAPTGSPFVKTLKRDYVHVTPLQDAQTVLGLIGGWIEDYNENHPYSGRKMRSPREFIAA